MSDHGDCCPCQSCEYEDTTQDHSHYCSCYYCGGMVDNFGNPNFNDVIYCDSIEERDLEEKDREEEENEWERQKKKKILLQEK